MAEYFMGQELIQGELPANSPKPAETPPEGVIMTDVTGDGWKRRYIYIAMSGSAPEEILISETPPNRVSGAAVAVEEASLGEPAVAEPFAGLPSERRARVARPPVQGTVPIQQAPVAAGIPVAQQQSPVRMNVPVQQAPVPVSTISIQKAAPQAPVAVQASQAPVVGGQVAVPYVQTPVEQKPEMAGNLRLTNSLEQIKPVSVAPIADVNRMAQAPIRQDGQPIMLGQGARSLPLTVQESRKSDLYPITNPIGQNAPMAAGMTQMGGSPSAFMNNQVPLRGLGQAAPAASEAPASTGSKCPGAVEMPDGRVIEPGDGVSLQDLCELMPFLVESLTNLQSKGLAPGQKLSVVGQKGQGVAAVPTAAGSFGPAGQGGGPFGSAGGMSFGGGGGAPGPMGPQGPIGVPGATGPGSIVEPPLIKTDGDFIAGPGAFVVVPGTLINFALAAAGVAQFDLLATVGLSGGAAGFSQSLQLGLRIDGTDYALLTRLLHTFAGGVGEFMVGQTIDFAMSLGAGPHSVEVILRGLAPGEYGAGLGISAGICAIPSIPLVLTVSHS